MAQRERSCLGKVLQIATGVLAPKHLAQGWGLLGVRVGGPVRSLGVVGKCSLLFVVFVVLGFGG